MPKTDSNYGIDMSRRNKAPRPLTDAERARLEEFVESIHYSARYCLKFPSPFCFPFGFVRAAPANAEAQILRQRIRVPSCPAP